MDLPQAVPQKSAWVDALKFIGILAVILGHVASPLGAFIFSWHMPLFFFIAGFFLKLESSFFDFLKQSFKRLMVPYFIFSLIGLMVEFAKRKALHRDQLDWFLELRGIFWDMDMQGLSHQYGFVLWFLSALWVAQLSMFGLSRIANRRRWLMFLLTIPFFLLSFNFNFPFAIDNGFNALAWVALGNWFFKDLKGKSNSVFLIITGVILVIIFKMPQLDMASKTHESLTLNVVWALSIMSILIFFSEKATLVPAFKFAGTYWGSQTMFLFIFHPYTNNLAHLLMEKSGYDFWLVKLILSLVFLQVGLSFKMRFNQKGLLKYV